MALEIGEVVGGGRAGASTEMASTTSVPPEPSREIRLCGYVTAELDGAVLDGALCLGDFDGDGEDEIAVGTVTGQLSLFKYNASDREGGQVFYLMTNIYTPT